MYSPDLSGDKTCWNAENFCLCGSCVICHSVKVGHELSIPPGSFLWGRTGRTEAGTYAEPGMEPRCRQMRSWVVCMEILVCWYAFGSEEWDLISSPALKRPLKFQWTSVSPEFP